MSTFVCGCERCGRTRSCTYYGNPPDVDAGVAQNGEWLCEECVPLRIAELDGAIARMKAILRS